MFTEKNTGSNLPAQIEVGLSGVPAPAAAVAAAVSDMELK